MAILNEYRIGKITADGSGAFDIYTSGAIIGEIVKIFYYTNSGGSFGVEVTGSLSVTSSGLFSQTIWNKNGTMDVNASIRPVEYVRDNTNAIVGSPQGIVLPFVCNSPLRFVGAGLGPGSIVSGISIWYKQF
jgi:hypothetical protein